MSQNFGQSSYKRSTNVKLLQGKCPKKLQTICCEYVRKVMVMVMIK